MKLTVLVDNTTLIDRYFCGEPEVSYFIQDVVDVPRDDPPVGEWR